MALRDLQAFLEDDGLEYPVPANAFAVPAGSQHPFPAGKTYRVPSPDAKTGLWLTGLAETGVAAVYGHDVTEEEVRRLTLDDNDEREFYQRVLGSAYDEMLTDGLSWTALQRIGQDAYMYFALGQQIADAALMPGNQPARQARAAKRTGKKTAGGRSRASQASTATASPTPSPASPGSSTSPTPPVETAAAV